MSRNWIVGRKLMDEQKWNYLCFCISTVHLLFQFWEVLESQLWRSKGSSSGPFSFLHQVFEKATEESLKMSFWVCYGFLQSLVHSVLSSSRLWKLVERIGSNRVLSHVYLGISLSGFEGTVWPVGNDSKSFQFLSSNGKSLDVEICHFSSQDAWWNWS